jgi:hypothetical protein
MLRTKLSAYATRESAKDLSDITFMLRKYPSEIQDIADSIPVDVRKFFVRNSEDSGSGGSVATTFRQILKVPDEDDDDENEHDDDE